MRAILPTLIALLAGASTAQQTAPRGLVLEPCAELGTGALCGSYEVWENREARRGRRIELNIVLLEATGPKRQPDPVFYLAGGPGQGAASLARAYVRSWIRRKRDIVLVDQRGTGSSNPLPVRVDADDDDLQSYLEPMFREPVFRAAIPKLERHADLTMYTTPIAMDDLNEVRQALAYDRINLIGGSYGTRAALVYMRRHPETVRSAILIGVAPIAFLNPLYHAAAAQEGYEALCAECAGDARYREAFGDLKSKLDAILERLAREPAVTTVAHPATGDQVEVRLSRDNFAEALRVMMYYMPTNRAVPLLVRRAYEGDYRAFAQAAIRSNRGLRQQLALGMLMSVVGSEDIPRIDPDEIDRATAGTFLGDGRVRQQMRVAEFWPKGDVPSSYGEPVSVDVPVLLLSGTFDPVTPPRWGAEAASHLPNSLHVVVPAAHGVNIPRVTRLQREFLDRASVEDLDTSFVSGLRPPRLQMPK